ncbi:MAG: hypothetical protein H0U42_07140 [Thermoleophilaceae bacterium]|nr:hypothetical protein [Thermoleophilaceae bacterium]
MTDGQKVPGGGKAKEKEQVAPLSEQGDRAPGDVEAGASCIPNQSYG